MLARISDKNGTLTVEQIAMICQQAFEKIQLTDKNVLFIIPDNSRTTPMDVLFRIVYHELANRVKNMDFLVALGTHPQLSRDELYQRVGINATEHVNLYSKARFFNHNYKDPKGLVSLGTIPAEFVGTVSHGIMEEAINVTINKMIFNYDILIIIGPTFPHEVVGFSGGNKYFFPGIAGQEIIDKSHWLGALITNFKINGIKETPVRAVLDKAASLISVERYCLSHVVRGHDIAGLFIGTPEEAYSEAADLSARLNIIYKPKPFVRVLSQAPAMYEDLWTAGKCMYKLEPVVSDGGELIIYAPHIREVSVTHGRLLEKIGYHVRDYFLQKMNEFDHVPKGLLAHSTHVKGAGEYMDGIEKPRINVLLATQLSEKTCRQINLGYVNPDEIDVRDWEGQEESGILYVPKAGEQLFRLSA